MIMLKTYFDQSAFVTNEHHTLNVCFSKNTQGGEVPIIGQNSNWYTAKQLSILFNNVHTNTWEQAT